MLPQWSVHPQPFYLLTASPHEITATCGVAMRGILTELPLSSILQPPRTSTLRPKTGPGRLSAHGASEPPALQGSGCGRERTLTAGPEHTVNAGMQGCGPAETASRLPQMEGAPLESEGLGAHGSPPRRPPVGENEVPRSCPAAKPGWQCFVCMLGPAREELGLHPRVRPHRGYQPFVLLRSRSPANLFWAVQ